MSYASDRLYRRIVLLTTLVAFPIALLIFMFSGCDLRKRSEKQACRNGAAEQCLGVARFYEQKADGIVGFAMSNGATAATYYDLGCKHGSSVACERLGHLMFHGFDSAKDYEPTYEDAVDALAQACVDHVTEACGELTESFTDPHGQIMAEDRAARFFLDACNKSGTAEACYQFGLFVTVAHGVLPAKPELAKKYFTKACAAGHREACTKSK
jgi:TPR repeat protein